MLFTILLFILVQQTGGSKDAGECKEILQGFLSGQLSSALQMFHVKALRREFKSFKKSLQNTLKEIETKNKLYTDKSIGILKEQVITSKLNTISCFIFIYAFKMFLKVCTCN